MSSKNNISKNRYIRNFYKDSKLIFTIIIIIFIWSFIYLSFFYHPSYKSSAKIWIKDLATEAFVTNSDEESQLRPLTVAGNPLLTQIEIIKSNQLRSFLIDYIRKKYPQKYTNRNISVDKIIEAKNKVGTDIISITLTWDNPAEAKELLDTVLNEYDNINLLINKKIKTARRKYIDVKLTEIEGKLLEIRDKIKLYKSENLVTDIDEESKEMVAQKVDISTRMEEIAASISSSQSSINQLEKQLSLKPNEALKAVALGSGNQNLLKLRADLNEAMQQYEYDIIKLADTNPKIIAQKNKIDAIKKQIRDQIKLSLGKYAQDQKINIFDPVREKMAENLIANQVRYISLKSEHESLSKSIGKINSFLSDVPGKKFALGNLEQTERALSNAYDELKQKQIEARIKEAEAVSNVVVIDAPNLPGSAAFPSHIQVFLLSLVLGCGLGFSVSVLKTWIEDICDNPEMIEYITNTSIIGSVPWFGTLTMDDQSHVIYNIAYNNILSSLMLRCYKKNAKVLTFTSTSVKKPLLAIMYQLACGLKKHGHSVVIIDTDIKIPTIHKDAGIEDQLKVNLSELIMFIENKIRKNQPLEAKHVLNALTLDSSEIYHLGNSDSVFESYELFGTSGFKYILETLRENFDWVLVDSAAAHISPEFLMVSRICDGVVLFINRTVTYSTLRDVTKFLKNAEVPIIGTIIRQKDSSLEKEYEKYLEHQEKHLRAEIGDDWYEDILQEETD